MSLTQKQRQILDAIVYLIRRGEIPTVREVGALVGLRSPATVQKHLRALEEENLITRSGKSRGIRIADPDLFERLLQHDGRVLQEDGRGDEHRDEPHRDFDGIVADPPAAEGRGEILQTHFPELSRAARASRVSGRIAAGRIAATRIARQVSTRIPLLGAIAAGRPIETRAEAFAGSEVDGKSPALAIDPRLFATSGELIALRIEGDSMIGAGILDGDYAIIRRQETVEEGEIAAVLVGGEATLKRWHYFPGDSSSGDSLSGDSLSGESEDRSDGRPDRQKGNGESGNDAAGPNSRGTIRLQAANEHFESLEITEEDRKEVLVIGKYVGLVRGAQILW